MKTTGKVLSNPTCRIDELDRFIVQLTIKVSSRISEVHYTSTYNLKGKKVASYVYQNIVKGDRVTVSININGHVYNVTKAN